MEGLLGLPVLVFATIHTQIMLYKCHKCFMYYNILFFCHNIMYKNVIDPGKSVSFVLKDIDIGGQNQYVMCTGPF